VRNRRARGPLRTARVPSPVGVLQATLSETGLVSLAFPGTTGVRSLLFTFPDPEVSTLPLSARKVKSKDLTPLARLAEDLSSYFAGRSRTIRTPLDLGSATPFQQRVWDELRRVPFGKTLSYAELARRAGAPRAARAVGQAVGANPIPILIPCHRVVRSDGGLGGFSAGLEIKRWLLRHEGCL